MCDNRHFKLCSCGEEEWEHLDEGTIIWVLQRYAGRSTRRGKIRAPEQELSGKITSVWFEARINENNAFDFEYIPQESDRLWVYIRGPVTEDGPTIRNNERMGFVYRNGAWVIGNAFGLKNKFELYGKGRVEFLNGLPEQYS